MQLITTTQLRTKSKELVATLLSGKSVNLIHRSRVIGEVKPKKQRVKLFSASRMKEIVDKLNFKPLSDKEIEKRYRQHLVEKYGKNLS